MGRSDGSPLVFDLPTGHQLILTPGQQHEAAGGGVGFLLGLLPLFAYILWQRVVHPVVADKISYLLDPVEDEIEILNLLAQIGAMTKGCRVLFSVFHNGEFTASSGFSFQKVTTTHVFRSPGTPPLQNPAKNVPLGRIIPDVPLFQDKETEFYAVSLDDKDLKEGCAGHLIKESIYGFVMKMVRIKNVPIGLITIHWTTKEDMESGMGVLKGEFGSLRRNFELLQQHLRDRALHHNSMGRLLASIASKFKPPL